MYAVVQVGNFQFKVSEGDSIEVDRLSEEIGKTVELEQVLLLADDKQVQVGKPYLKDVKIAAKVKRHLLDEKKVAFKYRKRKDSMSRKGHRQQLTMLNIEKISK